MLAECNKCKKEILTECDIHLVIPNQNYAINCGCELLQKEQQLEKQNAMMREALEFYADRTNWRSKVETGVIDECDSIVDDDEYFEDTMTSEGGKRAREVLEKINKGE
jgi:hypothetical protein